MTDINTRARRIVSWQYLMDVLADMSAPDIVNDEWQAMRRRQVAKYWREWRQACREECND